MFRAIALTFTIFSSSLSLAATSPAAIHKMLDEAHYALDHQAPTPQELDAIQASLQGTLDLLYRHSASVVSPMICAKQNNGMFYPAKRATGEVVGDTSYNAGHAKLSDCRDTLPKVADATTCFKRTNGLYYPTNSTTGAVIGSTAYSAGYAGITECLASVQ
jgi:hypothetical protein